MLPSRKQLKHVSKSKSLLLLQMLLQAAVAALGSSLLQDLELAATIYGVDHTPHSVCLKFDAAGTPNGLASLPELNGRASDGWHKLASSGWCDRLVTSSLDYVSLWDLALFRAWAKGSGHFAWHDVCGCLYPELIKLAAQLLERQCMVLAGGPLRPVPLLRTAAGNVRRIARGNRLLLFDRCKQQKRHRAEVLRTHKDITAPSVALLRQEAAIEVRCYMKKLFDTFGQTVQVQCSWDESHYDTSTMVLAIYDWRSDMAGFLPIQVMAPILSSELTDEVRILCLEGRATRLEGFSTMRALSHGLSSIGLPLKVFEWPKSLWWKPLTVDQRRIHSGGKFWIYDLRTEECVPQVPEGLQLNLLPILTSGQWCALVWTC